MWTSLGLALSSPESALSNEPWQPRMTPEKPHPAESAPPPRTPEPHHEDQDLAHFSPSIFFAEQAVEGWDVLAPTAPLIAC